MTDERPALGIRLTLLTTEAGGRRNPVLDGSSPYSPVHYQPNWGLPGWTEGEQSGAPVLGFAESDVRPGETTDAVIIALFADRVRPWWAIVPGDQLRMYEGSRVCGLATVLWIDRTSCTPSDSETDRLISRLGG